MADEVTTSIPAGIELQNITLRLTIPSNVNGLVKISDAQVGRIFFYVCSLILALAVWLIERHFRAGTQYFGEFSPDLRTSQQSQLSAFLEMNRLLITLSTTTLGAVGFFCSRDKERAFSTRELWAASACVLCVGLSLFYGYCAYQDVIYMLANDTFDLNSSLISWDRELHFATFLLGALFFVDFAFNELNKKKGSSSP